MSKLRKTKGEPRATGGSFTTRRERIAAGRSLRERVARESHGAWNLRDRDPVTILDASNEGRVAELVPIRYGRMLQSPFTFYRGSAALMAHDLATTPNIGVTVQACGDCHLMNFGLFATAERNLVFDVNDLDETLPAPWEWDLKRLVVSAVIASRSNRHSPDEQAAVAMACASSYRTHLREYSRLSPLEMWYERIDWQTIIDLSTDEESRRFRTQLGDKARRRIGANLVAKIVERKGARHRFIDDPPLLFHPSDPKENEKLQEVATRYRDSLADERRALLESYHAEDFAIKVVGIGSVGTRCFVGLFYSEHGHPLILQFKEARPSVLEPYAGASVYENCGRRVVMGQRLMQASSDIFLGWARSSDGRDFYGRQLRDMKMSAPLENVDAVKLARYVTNCAWALARAHARSGHAAAEVSGYLGKSERFDAAMAAFGAAYADQNERDYKLLLEAVKQKRIAVVRE